MGTSAVLYPVSPSQSSVRFARQPLGMDVRLQSEKLPYRVTTRIPYSDVCTVAQLATVF